MKKLTSLILCAAAVISLAACGQKAEQIPVPEESETRETGTITGGWIRAGSPVVTDEIKMLLDKAMEGTVGANYIPVAYLGSQVTAGTNHAILCRVSPVIPEPVETYAIVYLFEALDGSVEITKVVESGEETNINNLSGGWFAAESPR